MSKIYLTEDQKRIIELETGLKDILKMNNLETIKTTEIMVPQ